MIKTMKRILLLCLLQCFVFGFSQKLRPVAQKVSDYHTGKIDVKKYDLFEVTGLQKNWVNIKEQLPILQ
jgi:hypothetical protein